MENAYFLEKEEVLTHFGVQSDKGLNDAQVEESRKKHGKNEISEDERTPLWKLILEQFEDNLVRILLMAAFVSFGLAIFEEGEERTQAFIEPFVILLILIANATVGVIQETNAEKAIEALKEYTPDEAKVIRNSKLFKIQSVDLVPGDIVEICVGDKIPADMRVIAITSTTLRVDEAILTGESVSKFKQHEAVKDKEATIQDKISLVFSGTTVTQGKGRCVVVGTGVNTAIGQIHEGLTQQESEKTPLKKKLDEFGTLLSKVIGVICILVWLINFQHFDKHGSLFKGGIYYFKIAVALAVAAIPEGLPAVITTCLALGTMKMAKKNAIVRSLPSVETLGSTTVICSDKTGTLTTNKMSCSKALVLNSENGGYIEVDIEGSSFEPKGDVLLDGKKTDIVQSNPVFTEMSQICSMCNDSKIIYNDSTKHFENVGEPTEAALRVMVEKFGSNDQGYNNSLSSMNNNDRASAVNHFYEKQFDKLATIEFSRDRKSMSAIVNQKSGGQPNKLFVKGAPEAILERCQFYRIGNKTVPKTDKLHDLILQKVTAWGTGQQTLRCLALATVDEGRDMKDYDFKDTTKFASYESNMTFVGIVGMLDPPRTEVSQSIAICKQAGIRVIVITGDNKNTAEAICRRIGLFGPNEDTTGKSFTGREFDRLSAAEKDKAIRKAKLFSRTEPAHKMEIVKLLQKQDHVAAMTGDGVNDAPALKKADIGVAMGSGTAVAKEASDMVLADDNFATIVTAVEEGRSIFNNTKQFIRYLISSNIGEVVCIFLTVLLGTPEALIPVQLLWVNLVTDGLPATALGFNPPDKDIMHHPPRKANEPIVSGWLFFRYMIIGIYVGVATVGGYIWWFMYYSGGPQISFYQLSNFHDCQELFPEIGCEMFHGVSSMRASTVSLSILVTIEMFNAFNSLSENQSLLSMPPWVNPYLIYAVILSMTLHFIILYVPIFATMFSITGLNLDEWIGVLFFSIPVILLDEILKFVSRIMFAAGKQKID